jgi:hypothetical protein
MKGSSIEVKSCRISTLTYEVVKPFTRDMPSYWLLLCTGVFPRQTHRQARNLSDHASAASRMTRQPTRRTEPLR